MLGKEIVSHLTISQAPLMSISIMALLHVLLLLSPRTSTAAYTSAYPYSLCEGDNFAAGSVFQSNLNALLYSLSTTNVSTFVTDDKGSPPNRAYGVFLCRGDIASLSSCRDCARNATKNILQLCPFSKEATAWYETCQLRYSDLSSFDDIQTLADSDDQKVKDPDTFNKLLRELLEKIFDQAAYNSTIMFATGTASVRAGDSPEVYGLAQCTRDISKDKCYQCLQQNFGDRSQDFAGKRGAIILAKSCNFRYEVFKFFEGVPAVSLTLSPPVASPPPSTTDLTQQNNDKVKKRSSSSTVLVIIIPSAAALVLTLSICICFWRRSRKKFSRLAKLEKISYVESLLLELSTIKAATADFSPANKLGEGGFGSVYKGILPDGQEIAVKRLSTSSSQGIEELKNELVLVAKLQHKNLIRLLGVCLEKEEKLLVYEYVPNKSLDTFLFVEILKESEEKLNCSAILTDPIQQKQLNWEMWFKIIEGIAQGLHYLHGESHVTVIHRDLKASNILLDADMNPKISDFGLSKLFGCEEKECTTRRVVGTLGYMAPEYIRRGQLSMKSDVYSFGVLLLEIVTGRKRSKFHHSGNYSDLIYYAWEHWINGRALEILDPSVNENFSQNEVLICIQIGLQCAQEVPAERPLMSSVLLMLNSHSVTLPAPSQPTSDGGTSASEISEQRSDLACIPSSCNNASISVLEPR